MSKLTEYLKYMMRLELENAAKAAEEKTQAEVENLRKSYPAETIITRPPAPLRIDGPVVESAPQHPEEPAGPSLAPAPLMGGTHQRKRGRPRNPEAEAFADGSAPDQAED